MEQMTILKLSEQVHTEGDAYLFMEKMRWGNRPVCPHCGSEHVNYIKPVNGVSRTTRTGSVSERRVWKCQACPGRKQFSVLTGTIFHGTKIPVRTWLFVVFEMCASKNGVAAREIERKYGLSPKSAWFMLHRIREAMKREPLAGLLAGLLGGNGGVVVADETFIGGKRKNKHKSKLPEGEKFVPGDGRAAQASYHSDKTAVLSLIDTTTGEARSVVVRDVTASTLRKHIADQVDMAETVLHTDEARAYGVIAPEFLAHETVNHSADEYVRYTPTGTITSNQAESFFSQLKRSLDGTHHAVSVDHLHRYLGEFDFRHTTRKITDTERMAKVIGQVGDRRLSYRPLTAGQ